MTAAFRDVPTRHAEAPFSIQLRFSEALELAATVLTGDGAEQAGALAVAGGTITGAAPIEQSGGQRWTITIAPEGAEAIEIELQATAQCGAPSAICTADGRALSESISAQVAGPVPVGPPLTASFHDLPETHGGEPFTLELRFSEGVTVGFATLRDQALDVRGGDVTDARRLEAGNNARWAITV